MSDRQPLHPVRIQLALSAVAVVALGLGFWQIHTLIYLPFVADSSQTSDDLENSDLLSAINTPTQEDLQTKDTDGDGLSDYDEINLYKTSAYLKDTDSDGYDDKKEITSNHDPNCPVDGGCASGLAKDGSSLLTPAQIREVLKQKGADPALLAKYDDATLLELYKELGAEQATAANSPTALTNPTAPAPQLSVQDKQRLSNMSGSELRKFLTDNGAEATVLEKFDDATLKALLAQTLGI